MNYAEDKDNDMDYEYTTTSSAASSSKSTAGVAAEVVVPTTASSRRASAVGGSGSRDKEGAKENTAMVATTTSSGSKKRKNNQIAPVMPRDIGLSNMLSFENPYLKDGQLIADDGTTLSVNGTKSSSQASKYLVSKRSFTKTVDSLPLQALLFWISPANIFDVLQITSISFASLPANPTTLLESWNFYTQTTTPRSLSIPSESTGIIDQKTFNGKLPTRAYFFHRCTPTAVHLLPFVANVTFSTVPRSKTSTSFGNVGTASISKKCLTGTFTVITT